MKGIRVKNKFLEHLRKLPNISSACDSLGISRQTIYRWKKESKKFAEFLDAALSEGEDHIDDFAENQLMVKIKEGSTDAIKYYLTRRHKKYIDKKLDPVLVKFITGDKKRKDQELMNKAYMNAKSKLISHIQEDSVINIDENSLKNMLKFNFISEQDYRMFMEVSDEGEKNITSEQLIHEDLEKMTPKPEEVLEEYKELKKDSDQN